MRRLLLAASALLATAPVSAQEPHPDPSPVHVVRPGDTLWGLARQYLQSPYLWSELYRLNRGQVADPDRIFPGEQLQIPGALPAPAVDPGSSPPAAAPTSARPETEVVPSFLGAVQQERLTAILPGDFYRAGMLVREEEVVPVGELVEVLSPSVVPSEMPRAIQPYDRVFMRLASSGAVRVGDRLHLMRGEREIRPFGRIFGSTGTARVVALDGTVATVEIEEMYEDVAVGDLALPMPGFPVAVGAAPRAAGGLNGRIVAFQSPHALHTLQDVAFLDLGADSGVKEGDEFLVVLPPERKSWGVRPEITVARLQVVRASRRTSAARVVEMEHPALEPGLVVRLVGKMP